jgi:hypothetical protein
LNGKLRSEDEERHPRGGEGGNERRDRGGHATIIFRLTPDLYRTLVACCVRGAV